MAHFAELDSRNIVKRVIVVHNNELLDADGNEVEQNGINFCRKLLGGTWVQTSYNANIRGCFAVRGQIYDTEQEIFRAPTEEELNPPIVISAPSTANDIDVDEFIVLSGDTSGDNDFIVLSGDTSADNEIIFSTAEATATASDFDIIANDSGTIADNEFILSSGSDNDIILLDNDSNDVENP